jgi:hypothetical protein
MSIAINKTIVKASAVAGLWTLTLSDVDGILIGAKGDVDGFLTKSYNHQNITVTAVDTTLKTIKYQTGNATVAEFAPDANFHLTITWIDNAYVEDMLGFSPTGSDLDYLTECVNSAQDWAYRKRAEAGYDPHPAYAGGADIRQGTGLMAMMLYRERGSVDSFQSYEQMATAGPVGSIGQIMRLLGIGRATVA